MTTPSPTADTRPLWPSLARGWRRRCPACGEGAMLDGYLTVRDACPACGEALHHQRADDGPAWLTIVVAGKIMAPVMLAVWEFWRPDPLVMALALSVTFGTIALWLLPRFKGGFIALQWSQRMHGFGDPQGVPAHVSLPPRRAEGGRAPAP
jgi:uncharacterized protein (DUF983 family)